MSQHVYEDNEFTPEQEKKLRQIASPSSYIKNFLTDIEFTICRDLTMSVKDWPEHGGVSKYWGFGRDNGYGPYLEWLYEKIKVLDPDINFDFWAIQEAIIPWKIHADIRWYKDKIPHKVYLLPMDVEGKDNHVYDTADWPDTYTISFEQRNFMRNARVSAVEIDKDQNVGNDQTNWKLPINNPKYENLQSGFSIDKETWQKYLNHMDYKWAEGLTIDQIDKWEPGAIMSWDNTALHAADDFSSNGIATKRSLMLFTTLNTDT
jgi:hypothetical protein